MGKQAILQELIKYTHQEILWLCQQITSEQVHAESSFDHWNIKDHLAHMAYWGGKALQRYRQPSPSNEGEVELEEENQRIYREYRAAPWDEVTTELNGVYLGFKEYVAGLSEDDLDRILENGSANPRSAWRHILGSVCLHPWNHFTMFYPELGLGTRGIAIQTDTLEAVLGLDPDPQWQGTTHYNLACAFALANHPEEALGYLGRGFQDYPALKSWARQDTDLVSLRQHPDFIRMTGSETD